MSQMAIAKTKEVHHMKLNASSKPYKLRKRQFLLLEVMIALALVSIAILPLLSPHFQIYQRQIAFTHKLEADLAAPSIYAALVQKLHQNEILFGDIELKTSYPIDTPFLDSISYPSSFPYRGKYHFSINKQKKNEQYGLYLVTLTLELHPKSKPKDILTYRYQIFISRLFQGSATDNSAASKGVRK